MTVEDPVEYRLTGINQIQINVKADLTFASALRSILRSDPDVIMVGEIRDAETAKMAIESALTGHFVLSTLHTNDAPGALTRLNEMGVEPFLTGSAVSAILAQRLARRLCTNCCEMYVADGRRAPRRAHLSRDRAGARGHGRLPQGRLPALQPDGLQGPHRDLPAADHERRARVPRGCERARATRSTAPPSRPACARSGTTASRRPRPGSPRSKSSPASSPSRGRTCPAPTGTRGRRRQGRLRPYGDQA